MMETKFTPGPWEHVPATEHHGHYISGSFGGDICDLYAMSDPSAPSTRNGGTSKPMPFSNAEANANLISAAPELYRENEQAALSLEEAAKLLFAKGLGGCASIMADQAVRCRAASAKARGEPS